MHNWLKYFFITLILTLSNNAMSSSQLNTEFSSHYSQFNFLNYINHTLKSNLPKHNTAGIKQISTIQKNRQIIIQVIHNPTISYNNMVQGIAQSASRVNGINFQNSFTLNILESYCNTDLFYSIQGKGLESNVMIKYEDIRGNYIAVHSINKQLCQL